VRVGFSWGGVVGAFAMLALRNEMASAGVVGAVESSREVWSLGFDNVKPSVIDVRMMTLITERPLIEGGLRGEVR